MNALSILAATIAVWLGLGVQEAPRPDIVAIAGCCKEREGSDWVNIGRDFDRCSERNASEGDDIFAPKGKIWWDSRC